MSQQFTPGPWIVVPGDDYIIRADALPADFPHRLKGDATGRYVADIGNWPLDFGQANASLIAAAPTLYEATAEVDRLLSDWSNGQHGADSIAAWESAAKSVRAALALARGESPK